MLRKDHIIINKSISTVYINAHTQTYIHTHTRQLKVIKNLHTFSNEMDETGAHHTEWSKPER